MSLKEPKKWVVSDVPYLLRFEGKFS